MLLRQKNDEKYIRLEKPQKLTLKTKTLYRKLSKARGFLGYWQQ